MPDLGEPLFISYSSHDAEAVKDVALRLKQRGVNVYLDALDQELPGRAFLGVIEDRLRKAAAVAVFIGSGGLGPFQRLEATLAVVLAAKKGLRVVPVLLPGAGQIADLELFMECFSWIDLRAGIGDAQIETLAAMCRPSGRPSLAGSSNGTDFKLSAVLKRTKHRLVIAGHTLDKFTGDEEVQDELVSLARQGKSITIVQLNPDSPYATAHRPFHELESGSPAEHQHEQTLSFFNGLFQTLNPLKRNFLDVSFSNYMPRFRAVVVDHAVYVYLYMYGADVADIPDLQLEPASPANDLTRRRILYSTLSAAHAPDSIPLIRSGQIFSYWRKTHIANWAKWTPSERSRHRLTHDFYIAQADAFDARYGRLLEEYVQMHLDRTKGPTLILGCGSGKEVEYLSNRRPDAVYGVDASYVAIKRARERCGVAERIVLGDFYDLDLPEFLDGQRFQSVVANAAFVHLLNRDDIDEILGKIWDRLEDGGLLFIRCLYKENQGGPINEEVYNDHWGPRWFVYYSPGELAERCRKAGFDVDHQTTAEIFSVCGLDPLLARAKGAKHAQFQRVYWPCVLAMKRESGMPAVTATVAR